MSKILCIDFDGVIHSYTSGWKGADVVSDPPVEEAIGWLVLLTLRDEYEVNIYSSRSSQKGGIEAMKKWLLANMSDLHPELARQAMEAIKFPTQKPPAYLTIDDRAICFRGTFPSRLELDAFKPWNKS